MKGPNIASKCKNFINITHTLTTKMQKKKCLDWSGDEALPAAFKIKVAQKSVAFGNVPLEVKAGNTRHRT